MQIDFDNNPQQQQQEGTNNEHDENMIRLEWEYLADILDRLLLIIFLVLAGAITGAIFLVGNVLEDKASAVEAYSAMRGGNQTV
jgi:hypothetical protein